VALIFQCFLEHTERFCTSIVNNSVLFGVQRLVKVQPGLFSMIGHAVLLKVPVINDTKFFLTLCVYEALFNLV
jgi:hypothetical protein